MGYFANGTDGYDYMARYCDRCVHNFPDDEELGCPVMDAHMLWNYEECNKEDSILHKIIPRDGVRNGECVFFTKEETND